MADAHVRLITSSDGAASFSGAGTLLSIKVLEAGTGQVECLPPSQTEPIACSGGAGDESSLPIGATHQRDADNEYVVTLTLNGATVQVRLDSV